jgi:hypothetical protein
MTSYLEQHMEYLNNNIHDINKLLEDKFVETKGPDMIEYLKQEKYF